MNGEVQLIVTKQSIPQSETSSESLGFSISAGQDYFLSSISPPLADFYPVGTKVVFYDVNVFPYAVVYTTYVTSVDDALSRVYVSPVLPAINAVAIDVYAYAPQPVDTYLDLFDNESISQNWRFTDLNNLQLVAVNCTKASSTD